MSREELSLINLLAYVELFSFPIRKEEAELFYIGGLPDLSTAISEALRSLVEKGLVNFDPRTDFYFFPGNELMIAERLRREAFSQTVLKKAEKIGGIISLLPWVKLVAVTGSLASLNCRPGDDIDLMILTARKRLWLTRAAVFLFLKLLGIKKGRSVSKKGFAVCVNVWMDESNLSLEGDHDLIIAFDLARAVVLQEKGNIYTRLLTSNSWISSYLPGWFSRQKSEKWSFSESEKRAHSSVINWLPAAAATLFDFAETLAYIVQSLVIEKKYPGNPFIKKSRERLWQHPGNSRGRIMARYRENLKKRLFSLGIFTERPNPVQMGRGV